MPPKKGLATAKKPHKYVYAVTDDEESSPLQSSVKQSSRRLNQRSPSKHTSTSARRSLRQDRAFADIEAEDEDPSAPRQIPKLSNPDQPCQASESFQSSQTRQSQLLANSLLPTTNQADAIHAPRRTAAQSTPQSPPNSLHRPDSPFDEPTAAMANMIPGGAFVPPNQQRNLRACMVCSIVRTYTQFMNGGCPNCEEFLELANNSEMVNDCTSQVFEGLITVADTSKSWVARYQRLEGYVPGVYATQVEGILPEELVSSIEAAGINYIPRDGSEDQMIPKD